jgi:hypothetical protein
MAITLEQLICERPKRKNLDVPGLDREREIGCSQALADNSAAVPSLSSLCASTAPARRKDRSDRHYRLGGTEYISVAQATNIIEAIDFAKLIGLHLVAHLSIHWSLTDVGDDPDGKLLAKFREGLDKWLHRRGIAFAAAWSRERQSGGQSDVEHCHLLFYLPVKYRTGAKLLEVEAAIYRLIKCHGRNCWDERVIKLVIHACPDGKYLIKGGGPKVWKLFRIRKEHRRLQGIIYGKRCGTTINIGRAARGRVLSADRIQRGAA